MATDTPAEAGSQARRPAIRLTFAYDESGVRVIDRTPVDKPVPPSVDSPPAARAADAPPPLPRDAVVTELRSQDDATTYRQVVTGAIPRDVEVFDPDLERGVRRHAVPLRAGVFTVIVPDDERAESVVLLGRATGTGARRAGVAPPPGEVAGPAIVELGRFSVRESSGGNG